MLKSIDNTASVSEADEFNKTERTLIHLYRHLSGRDRRCLWRVAMALAKVVYRRS